MANQQEEILQLGLRAREASAAMARAGTQEKNHALQHIGQTLLSSQKEILAANLLDLREAEAGGMSPAMMDRLRLTEERLAAMAGAVGKVAALDDPIGQVDSGQTRPNGLIISRYRVPLGVVGMIYESRPNVTVDAAALCLKSGNACILRGGREAIHTNRALAESIRNAIAACGLPRDAVQLVSDTSRESARAMMRLNGYIDVLIPRGGAGLIRTVVENATVPVIQTGVGNCHVYVDDPCDLVMAEKIIVNAKCSRPSVCNAAETLLVHKNIAPEFLPRAARAMAPYHVELRGCPQTAAILGAAVRPADEQDYATEFND